MAKNVKDIMVIRELAKKYAEIANKPVQEERRKLWSDHNSLKKTRPPVLLTYGMWNVWCREIWADEKLKCQDPFFRGYEKIFKMKFMQDEIGDDSIIEPWITLPATKKGDSENHWGVKIQTTKATEEGGAFHLDAMIKEWSEVGKLRGLHHKINEADTKIKHEKLYDAVGKIIEIDVTREPVYVGFTGDISTYLASIRGLQQMMLDMYEYPKELHKLLVFMRDAILTNHEEAEKADNFTLTCQHNQQPAYTNELPRPKPNSKPVKRKDLHTFFGSQEFTLISPEFHYEFLLQYQIPIMEKYGMSHYGCCEDLTKKIEILRKIKNLRTIAVTPVANYRKCAEQIKKDYVCSYRPNPTDMVCTTWDEAKIKRIITDAKDAFKDSIWHIHLKDVETLQGDISRAGKWVKLVKNIVS